MFSENATPKYNPNNNINKKVLEDEFDLDDEIDDDKEPRTKIAEYIFNNYE